MGREYNTYFDTDSLAPGFRITLSAFPFPLAFRITPLKCRPSSLLTSQNPYGKTFEKRRRRRRQLKLEGRRKMVILVVATTLDPASINPARALLAMPGWDHPGPTFDGIRSFVFGDKLRLLEHDNSIVAEDDLDLRWENATGEIVDEVIFLSMHKAVSNRPSLSVHPTGIPHLKEGDEIPQGGKPGWAAPPSPRIGQWLILLKKIAQSHNLVSEFEVMFVLNRDYTFG